MFFRKGNYIYVGSALNSLEQRIARHLRENKTIYWHIDYILDNKNVAINGIYILKTSAKKECNIAKLVGESGKPVQKFGSSDCSCISHLFFWSDNRIKTAEDALTGYGFEIMSGEI
ncbi:MAG: DUF123 domain-containing protein [Candidatus Humimicrobiaceae bacterium]